MLPLPRSLSGSLQRGQATQPDLPFPQLPGIIPEPVPAASRPPSHNPVLSKNAIILAAVSYLPTFCCSQLMHHRGRNTVGPGAEKVPSFVGFTPGAIRLFTAHATAGRRW